MRKRHASQYANFGSLHKYNFGCLLCIIMHPNNACFIIFVIEYERNNVKIRVNTESALNSIIMKTENPNPIK